MGVTGRKRADARRQWVVASGRARAR